MKPDQPAARAKRVGTFATGLLSVLTFLVAASPVGGTPASARSLSAGGAFGRTTGAAPTQAAPATRAPIVVESQSPWVMSGQAFQMRLQITAANPVTDKIQVQAFSRLTTRSSFENALAGRVSGVLKYPPVVVPLSQLQTDPNGGYDIDIPVNPSGSTPNGPGTFPAFSAIGDSGVFPLQVGLYSAAGVPEGSAITTFFVYAAAQGSATGLPKLNVALVVPITSPPSVGPRGDIQSASASESSRLQKLVTAIQGHQDVPVSLAVTPQTLDALQEGSTTDRSTLSSIAALQSGSDEILPATYARVSMGDLIGSGLGSELVEQFRAGASTLAKTFGPNPSGSTWVFDGPVDQATVNSVLSHGAERLIVPDGDLSPLPLAARQTTFALPTRLSGVTRGLGPQVYAADSLLTNNFDGPGGPVLAADHLLAEMAMIQLETPGIDRGVAVVPPHRWSADPQFLDTLLAGLAGHPLVQAVTASGLFNAVRLSDVDRTLAPPRSLPSAPGLGGGPNAQPANAQPANAQPPNGLSPDAQIAATNAQSNIPLAGSLAGDAAAIRDARRRVQAFQAVLASEQQTGEQLGEALLVAQSTDVTEAQRKAIINAVRSGSAGALRLVTLPGSSSITLTATKGQIPLTILSARGARAKVELRLSSQRLIFRRFVPPGGSCHVPTPTTEICELVVTGENTTLKVPVEARSSGVFPLDVSLWTPGGGIRLAREQNTVRSTAVSGVGVILIVVAVLSLALWWGRDLRHGRRARRLVPPPGADEPELRLDDPVVRDFFANPPPGYRGTGAGGGGETRAGGPRT